MIIYTCRDELKQDPRGILPFFITRHSKYRERAVRGEATGCTPGTLPGEGGVVNQVCAYVKSLKLSEVYLLQRFKESGMLFVTQM